MGKTASGRTAFYVLCEDGTETEILVCGRELWALEELIAAKHRGCTPNDTPGPRWSAYVHDLRGMGVDIETIHEPHEGDYPGWHGRYVLRSNIKRAPLVGAGRGAK